MHYDLIVVGGGIVGLGHAWAAAKRGQTVAVLDHSPRAEGASIRNFGMIWPIGQPPAAPRALAMRSRQLWLELGAAADFAVEPCGSLHLAHHDDEWAVLNEFAESVAAEGLELEPVTPERIVSLTPAANRRGLRGGLYSRTELRVTPPTAIRAATAYLAETLRVAFHFDTPITQVDTGQVTSSNGQTWTAERIVIATGAYFRHLFPEAHTAQKLRLCKLQMMLTEAQPVGWKLGPHIASGLTLRHYPSFAGCPSLAAVKERFAQESPELDRYGIHVMASQADNGGLILGDSHEYDEDIEPVDKAEIDALMLRELQKIIHVPTWNIARRWHGLYAKHPQQLCFVHEVRPEVLVVNGFGGNGMTLSLAFAESVTQRWPSAPQWDTLGSS